jgi:hypothetical protein
LQSLYHRIQIFYQCCKAAGERCKAAGALKYIQLLFAIFVVKRKFQMGGMESDQEILVA